MGTTVRILGFTLMAIFGLVGTLFVVGETFADPGGLSALVVSVAWVAPMVALSGYALARPVDAVPFLVGVTTAVLAFALVDALFRVVPRDRWGPVTAIAVFALGVTLAFLGLRLPRLAGLLLLGTGLVQLLATVLAFSVHETGEGPGFRALLGTSSGVVVLPLLVTGGLFLLASLLEQHAAPPASGRVGLLGG
jgi:hypothetical protein